MHGVFNTLPPSSCCDAFLQRLKTPEGLLEYPYSGDPAGDMISIATDRTLAHSVSTLQRARQHSKQDFLCFDNTWSFGARPDPWSGGGIIESIES